MQVENNTLHQTPFVCQENIHSTPSFPALLPLHGYHYRLSITAPSWTLPAFATHVISLPAELIDMIQAFCTHNDLLSLTSVNKAALATRFSNPRLQKLSFKTVQDTEQFLSYCQTSQERETQELVLEEGQKSQRSKTASSFDPTMRFTLFTREQLQAVEALTLTISDQFTAEQYDLLFTYLPGIKRLTIHSITLAGSPLASSLSPLFKAAQRLTLYHLAINNLSSLTEEFAEDNLPDELWQFTTLETLTIRDFMHIVSIPEEIGQLRALKSLTLNCLYELKALPASIWQLGKLESLTLKNLYSITALPEAMGQLRSLKSLELSGLSKLEIFASIGQLNKLEALTLKHLDITALPEEMDQLRALKSLTLQSMRSLRKLPASLGQLDKLEALTLKGLNFFTLSEKMGQLKALKSLTLDDLRFLRKLPASLGQLDKLEVLILRDLECIDALPEEMGQLNALKIFKLIDMYPTLPEKLAQIAGIEESTP
jgi:Leucine-rich repeat (LRR) protein